ncbi:Phosphatidylinositol 3,4,5-trisphosphate 3-phosphatase ptn1 [Beauveria bassiana]|nr:Phosphatidylinositol 3,4,5-trisphosphate 3-phosphatase ptn1 [Beauveria bassiana]
MTSTDSSIESSSDNTKPSSESSREEPCQCSFDQFCDPQSIALPESTDSEDIYQDTFSQLSSDDASQIITLQPARCFSRWMSSLRRRTMQRRLLAAETPALLVGLKGRSQLIHRDSSSGSSFGFVAGVKSATVSISSTRIARSTGRSIRTPLGRSSEESTGRVTPADRFSVERALRRRRILEELIQTEESYVKDVRLLMNVYVTTFAACPGHDSLRLAIHQNLTEILRLHDEILGELHRAVPYSEYSYADAQPKGHRRWSSVDLSRPDMLAEPQTAAQVAKIFSQKVKRFFVYEEYGVRHENMLDSMPDASLSHRGIEALASTLHPIKQRGMRKSSTLHDLMIKPIQRVCRYPLLFAELLKNTPVCDCPNSHMEVESSLIRLREATSIINQATDDANTKARLEQTWILQDRLAFPGRKLDSSSKSHIRSFGQIRLCGVLHACWQGSRAIHGMYMICLLYRDVFCLATAGKVDAVYDIKACINIHKAKLEETDDGRAREESEWRGHLASSAKDEDEGVVDAYTTLAFDIKGFGSVFGKPGSVARRISIHRATTLGARLPHNQVILKNTSVKDNTSTTLPINRSQSLLSTQKTPVLAPDRSERARLEALVSDVWSR